MSSAERARRMAKHADRTYDSPAPSDGADAALDALESELGGADLTPTVAALETLALAALEDLADEPPSPAFSFAPAASAVDPAEDPVAVAPPSPSPPMPLQSPLGARESVRAPRRGGRRGRGRGRRARGVRSRREQERKRERERLGFGLERGFERRRGERRERFERWAERRLELVRRVRRVRRVRSRLGLGRRARVRIPPRPSGSGSSSPPAVPPLRLGRAEPCGSRTRSGSGASP